MSNINFFIFLIFLGSSLQAQVLGLNPKAKKGKWGFKYDGKLVLDYQFDQIEKTNAHYYLVKKDNKWGAVNGSGRLIIACENDQLAYGTKGKGFYAAKDRNHGMFDVKGKELVPFLFLDFNLYGEILVANQDGLWGAKYLEGEQIIPFEYQAIEYNIFSKAFLIKKNDKWGAIDFEGNLLIPIIYENIDHYSEEKSLVKLGDDWGYLIDGKIENSEQRIVFSEPEKLAKFKNCPEEKNESDKQECAKSAMLNHIYRKIRYPKEAREKGIQGISVVSLLISPEGKISEVVCILKLEGGCDEESIRVINLMNDWVPAEQDGKKVWSRISIPIKYKLQ